MATAVLSVLNKIPTPNIAQTAELFPITATPGGTLQLQNVASPLPLPGSSMLLLIPLLLIPCREHNSSSSEADKRR